MNNVIKFPQVRTNVYYRNSPEVSINSNQDETYCLTSKEDDHDLFLLLKKWPCFEQINLNLKLNDVLESYYDNELNEAQNCVIEYLFHMRDPSSSFDIAKALYVWEEEDKNFFILSLSIHAELINLLPDSDKPL